jgi:hypothetical protein
MTYESNNSVYKFWVHDPSRVQSKGHPRTLVAFRINGRIITYAHTTWNPTDPEPFDRAHAIKRVEGRLRCPKRQHMTPLGLGDPRKEVLKAIIEDDKMSGRDNTARFSACYDALAEIEAKDQRLAS